MADVIDQERYLAAPDESNFARWCREHDMEAPEDPNRHLDGVPYWEAPIPGRFHKCWVQTLGWVQHVRRVDRCACGAIRLFPWPEWTERNSRRKA